MNQRKKIGRSEDCIKNWKMNMKNLREKKKSTKGSTKNCRKACMKKEKEEMRTKTLKDKIATSWVINYIKLPKNLSNGRLMHRVTNQGLNLCEQIMMRF